MIQAIIDAIIPVRLCFLAYRQSVLHLCITPENRYKKNTVTIKLIIRSQLSKAGEFNISMKIRNEISRKNSFIMTRLYPKRAKIIIYAFYSIHEIIPIDFPLI